MNPNLKWMVCFLLFFAAALTGCQSAKSLTGTEAPVQPASAEGAPAAKRTRPVFAQYSVQPKDTLWGIAGKSEAYGDSFQWPLLYKSNRDLIQDPDLIYPDQTFRVEKGFSAEETFQARKMAMATPRYQPHRLPRRTLPVDYF